mmetsp:Transcript_16125/g.40978  ORF Transcript_16125/g.40978 Transcript_16125/m.40978 type:complete len:669 (-) Transcript_16125:254-2260(-)
MFWALNAACCRASPPGGLPCMADPAASFSPALMGWPAAAYRPHTDAPTQQTFLHISRHDAAFRAEGAVQAIDSRRAGAPVVCRAVSLAYSKVAFEVRLSIVGEEVQMEAKEAAEMDKMYSSCCGGEKSCPLQKAALESASPPNFCSVPGLTCDPASGRLLRLSLPGAGLKCTGRAWSWARLTSFPALEELDLSGNPLRLRLADAEAIVGGLPALRYANLEAMRISGELTRDGGLCKAVGRPDGNGLRYLNLASNRITGKLPRCLIKGPDLLSLQLSDNQLSGTLPDAFMYAQQLRDFGAASNQLTGSIPASLPYTPGLRQLTLAHNQLTGSITPWIGALSNPAELPLPTCRPQVLRVDDNQLDEIPLRWDGSRLRVFTASGNLLRAAVPPGMAQHPTLEWLDLSRNSLAWQANWTSLPELRIADLSENRIEGGFPADLLEAAPKLESLSLEGNQLSGPLPKLRDGSGASLRLLSVKGNKLSGDVPDSWTQLGVFTVLPGLSASPSAADLPELPDYNELNLADNPFFGVLPNLTRSLPEELKPHLRLSLLRTGFGPYTLAAYKDYHSPDDDLDGVLVRVERAASDWLKSIHRRSAPPPPSYYTAARASGGSQPAGVFTSPIAIGIALGAAAGAACLAIAIRALLRFCGSQRADAMLPLLGKLPSQDKAS